MHFPLRLLRFGYRHHNSSGFSLLGTSIILGLSITFAALGPDSTMPTIQL